MTLHFYFYFTLAQTATLVSTTSAGYNDTVNCQGFPTISNYSAEQLEQEALRFGSCVPYTGGDFHRPIPCNKFFTTNVDQFYLPEGRARNNVDILNAFVADTSLVVDMLSLSCRERGIRTLCYYYYPPCGNITYFEPPNAVCQDTCNYIVNTVCIREWMLTTQYLVNIEDLLNRNQIQFLNCTNPGAPLDPLSHCCSDAGVDTGGSIENEVTNTRPTTSAPTKSEQSSIVTITVSIVVVTAVLLFASTATIICMVFFLRRNKNIVLQFNDQMAKEKEIEEIQITPPDTEGMTRYKALPISHDTEMDSMRARVNSGYIRYMSESGLLIPGRHLKLLETVGQGEFGVVYKGLLTGWQDRATADMVAVKTLKSSYTVTDIEDLVKESEKMKRFNHPNVLGLIGVCIDAGEAPYIVLNFMANGSLLTYLRKERPKLTIAQDVQDNLIEDVQRKLLSICLQIANGMSYLATEKFVHRDLAARNCMIDHNFVIKVADFGLSEDVYSRNYFRQVQGEEGSAIKLPIRWMALESLLDGIFNEKTDVWSYGVTCWEVFSLGHTPYPAIDPFSLLKILKDGKRLEKPTNAACSLQIYEFLCGCWCEEPDKRPSFANLVIQINSFLESVAGYLDLSAFSIGSHHTSDHIQTDTMNTENCNT